ncbi:hypothetical protein [Paenibacillus senegalensis]|uniref:hypothetical protein n=1 Tax=Paenibacillus senegalensis TaxID=1465766 RepID=UPI000289263F|nr:hypothetical protein [Paenibacillus senegalensis]
MNYRYESDPQSYEDFASGRVLYNTRGMTAFPVRLASEIVQRAFQILRGHDLEGPYHLYDPCCGGAYLLTVVSMLHGSHIRKLTASDIDTALLETAKRNLALLSRQGMEQRRTQLMELYEEYGKPSHREALESLARLKERNQSHGQFNIHIFSQDVTADHWTHQPDIPIHEKVDLLLTDLPYGQLADWSGNRPDPLGDFFANVYPLLRPGQSVLAVIANKGPKLQHDQYDRVQYGKIGKRQFALMVPKQ